MGIIKPFLCKRLVTPCPSIIDNFLERTVDERRSCQKTHSFFFFFFLFFFQNTRSELNRRVGVLLVYQHF